jgi:hypothetical protein
MAQGGRLGTSEARRALSKLVDKAGRRQKPSASLLDNAVEIGSYRRRGAVLIPEVDARAHVEREAELERRVAELEQELDEILVGLLVEDRLANRAPGKGKPIEQVARQLGFGQLVDGS